MKSFIKLQGIALCMSMLSYPSTYTISPVALKELAADYVLDTITRCKKNTANTGQTTGRYT